MEPVRPWGNISLAPRLQDAWWPGLVCKEGRFLAGPGTSGYLGDLEKRGIHLNLYVMQAKSDGRFLVWVLSLERLLRLI